MADEATPVPSDTDAPPAASAPAAAAPAESETQEITLAELLGGTALFGGLAPLHLERLAAIGSEESHRRGESIFAEGDAGDRFYLILEGQVRISRTVPGMGEEALAILSPGDYFGEMALIDDTARSADARAHEACRLFVIRKEDLEDLMFVDRDLAYELLWSFVRTLSARLRETNNKMTFLATTAKF